MGVWAGGRRGPKGPWSGVRAVGERKIFVVLITGGVLSWGSGSGCRFGRVGSVSLLGADGMPVFPSNRSGSARFAWGRS